ncbi:hypothetical protein EDD21DRAFT_362894 [Dissophora ornata]|nr:hypothetical protein EDD21DRAFT_362894 [Dissophora ornata]
MHTMRPLTLLQRQRITLSLFFTVAVGAVFTVAAPAFVPWQVVDEKRAQALEQQRRQGKDFHVIGNHRRSSGGESSVDGVQETDASSNPSPAPISSQGPIISLLTDRPKLGDTTSISAASSTTTTSAGVDPSLDTEVTQDPNAASKKRRRRRKRQMVNEGWQELTGRTAREEKEKKHNTQTESMTAEDGQVLGENGGLEITWKNKTTT